MRISTPRRAIILLLPLFFAAACALRADTPKAPVDVGAEARYRKYFGLQEGEYATPPAVSAILRKWFAPGTSREKIRERLAKTGDLKASWQQPTGDSNSLLWVVMYSHTDDWDGKDWTTNCFCMEFTFRFDASGGVSDITGRWIMFPL